MTPIKVKAAIKSMKSYNLSKLHTLSEKSVIPLCTINFWWNAIKM